MRTTAKTHDPAFASLEITERLNEEQIATRARELLGQLTQGEKIKMMSSDPPFWLGVATPDPPWVTGAVPRLDIPGMRFADGLRGVIMDGGTTFPVSMGRVPPLIPNWKSGWAT